MIILKFILMTLLAIMPLILRRLIKNTAPMSQATRLAKPKMIRAMRAAGRFLVNLRERMKRSLNARKFFRMLMILCILIMTFVEFKATDTAADELILLFRENEMQAQRAQMLLSVMADPTILILSLLLNLSLFSDRWADTLLTEIHDSKKLQSILATFILMMAVYTCWKTTRYFILAEDIYIILLASWYYPPMNIDIFTGGGKRMSEKVTFENNAKKMKAA